MKEFVNDFDIWQDALRKINMNEAALPIYNGHYLYENGRTYLQMQKILDSEPMQKSHKFCLNIDPESPTEEEVQKVDQLYRLGVDRGFIKDDIDDTGDDEECDSNCESGEYCPDCGEVHDIKSYDNTFDKPTTNMPTSPSARPKFANKIPCYTIMYSATKDGQTKTGETYSNAVNPSAAKADAMAKLSRVGYDNVSILAIECGDPDMCGFDDTYTQEDDVMRNAVAEPIETTTQYSTSPFEDDLNETELEDCEDDILHSKMSKSMRPNNKFRNKTELAEGIGGAIGGAALGGLVGAAAGGMTGAPDATIGKTGDKFEMHGKPPTDLVPRTDSTSFMDASADRGGFIHKGDSIVGAAYNGQNAAIGAGVGAVGGGALGAMATSGDDDDDEVDESQITDNTASIVDDILNEYDGEEKSEAPKKEEAAPAPKEEKPKEAPKSEEPKTEAPKAEEPKQDDVGDTSFSFDIPTDDSSSNPDDDVQDGESDGGSVQSDNTEMNNMMDDATASSSNDGSSDDSQDDASSETAPGNLAGSEGSGAPESTDNGDSSTDSVASDNTEMNNMMDDATASSDTGDTTEDAQPAEELDANKKAEYKEQYTKTFKNVMLKCGFKGKKFDDLTLQEMTQVFASLIPAWGAKPDQKQFMTDKELDQLHEITIEA